MMVGLSGPLIPQDRVAVSALTFSKYFLPAFVSYWTMGVLVQRERTAVMRFALLPVVLLCTYRASVTLDFSFGIPNYRTLNQGLAVSAHNNLSIWRSRVSFPVSSPCLPFR